MINTPNESQMTMYPVSASLSIVHIVLLPTDAQRLTKTMFELAGLPPDVLRILQLCSDMLRRGAPHYEIKCYCLRPQTHRAQMCCAEACVHLGGLYMDVAPDIEEAAFQRSQREDAEVVQIA